jgi:hypothetical protein
MYSEQYVLSRSMVRVKLLACFHRKMVRLKEERRRITERRETRLEKNRIRHASGILE